MRIVGGRHRGRAIRVPKSAGLRPTADRVREAVFNILAHGIDWPGFDGAWALDVFAGTGAMGLEALSRGAVGVAFIDEDGTALTGIRRNAASMGEARAMVPLRLDATRMPPPPRAVAAPAAIAFLDPPYGSGLATPALQGLATRRWLDEGSLAVVEVEAREPLLLPPRFVLIDERTYGAARVVFTKVDGSSTAAAGEAGSAATR